MYGSLHTSGTTMPLLHLFLSAFAVRPYYLIPSQEVFLMFDGGAPSYNLNPAVGTIAPLHPSLTPCAHPLFSLLLPGIRGATC